MPFDLRHLYNYKCRERYRLIFRYLGLSENFNGQNLDETKKQLRDGTVFLLHEGNESSRVSGSPPLISVGQKNMVAMAQEK